AEDGAAFRADRGRLDEPRLINVELPQRHPGPAGGDGAREIGRAARDHPVLVANLRGHIFAGMGLPEFRLREVEVRRGEEERGQGGGVNIDHGVRNPEWHGSVSNRVLQYRVRLQVHGCGPSDYYSLTR